MVEKRNLIQNGFTETSRGRLSYWQDRLLQSCPWSRFGSRPIVNARRNLFYGIHLRFTSNWYAVRSTTGESPENLSVETDGSVGQATGQDMGNTAICINSGANVRRTF